MARGGKREGAGRKSKADEQKLIEKLTPLEGEALKALDNAIKAGESWAVTLFFGYMYGKPVQRLDTADGIEEVVIKFSGNSQNRGTESN